MAKAILGPVYFAGLKPGTSTEVEDISYAVISNRCHHDAARSNGKFIAEG
jgi:hypothetical protein